MRVKLTDEERELNRSNSYKRWYLKTRETRAEEKAKYLVEYRIKNKEEIKKKKAEKYLLTRESVISKVLIWSKANKEKTRASVSKWAKANREKANAITRKYIKNNSEKNCAKAAKNRARKLQSTPLWGNDFIMREAYHLAKLRTTLLGFKWHVDHIVPLKSKLVCGLHCEFNLTVIPAAHNLSKGNRYWPDMANDKDVCAIVI